MYPGFKYPIDEQVLKSKLLETSYGNQEQAWEKFELYLAQQKPIFTESKKTRLSLMIPPQLLLRGFLAVLIILPSLLFYRQFNTQIPAALHKAQVTTTSKKENNKAVLTTQAPPLPVLTVESITRPESEPVLNSKVELPKKREEPAKALSAGLHTDTLSKTNQTLPASQSTNAAAVSPSHDKASSTPLESTGELNEQL